MSANVYERLLLDDTLESYLENNEVMPDILQGDILERPFDPTHSFTNQIEVTVPSPNATLGDSLVWLPVVPAEPPSRGTSITVNTADDGSGTEFTIKTGLAALDHWEVRVYNSYPFIDFASSQEGNTVYVTVLGGESRWNAQIVRRLMGEVREVSTRVQGGGCLMRIRAGQGLDKGTMVKARLEGDYLVATPGSLASGDHPIGMVTETTASGSMTPVMSHGLSSSFGSSGSYRAKQDMGAGTWIYASKASGGWTFMGDTDSYYSLDEESTLIPLGQYLGNGHLFMCFGHPLLTTGAFAI